MRQPTQSTSSSKGRKEKHANVSICHQVKSRVVFVSEKSKSSFHFPTQSFAYAGFKFMGHCLLVNCLLVSFLDSYCLCNPVSDACCFQTGQFLPQLRLLGDMWFCPLQLHKIKVSAFVVWLVVCFRKYVPDVSFSRF